jgi:hypothetical protein
MRSRLNSNLPSNAKIMSHLVRHFRHVRCSSLRLLLKGKLFESGDGQPIHCSQRELLCSRRASTQFPSRSWLREIAAVHRPLPVGLKPTRVNCVPVFREDRSNYCSRPEFTRNSRTYYKYLQCPPDFSQLIARRYIAHFFAGRGRNGSTT